MFKKLVFSKYYRKIPKLEALEYFHESLCIQENVKSIFGW